LYRLKVRLLQLLLAYTPRFYLGMVRRSQAFLGRITTATARRKGRDANREISGRSILFVDHDFPDPTRNAGSKAIYHLVGLLLAEGFSVSFWSDASLTSSAGLAALERLGVECGAKARGTDLTRWLGKQRNIKPFNAVILSRPTVAAKYSRDVRQYASDRCLYYGHDVHHRRLMGMSRMTTQSGGWIERKSMERIEHFLWRTMDVVFYPSLEEVQLVDRYRQKLGLASNGRLLPLWTVPDQAQQQRALEGRSGMVFVGSFAHSPNVDGLNWFFEKILPRVRAKGYDGTFYVVGSGMEQYRPKILDDNYRILGWMDASALDSLYENVRMALAPLTYGAGVKGKVLEALSHGVPCVTTTVGAQGLDFAAHVLEPVDDAEAFAGAIAMMASDDAAWSEKSTAGLKLLAGQYRPGAIATVLRESIAS
jgi:glycosyltransferase involved in cell wall biosynthesis